MGVYNFFIYFILPAFALFLIFTNKYYYSAKQSKKMRFNMREDLFFGNIIAPIIGLLIILGVYIEILDFQYIGNIRWELLSILAITVLAFIVGIGLGGHITAISIERVVPAILRKGDFEKILYFFHWPFGHIVPFVPATLILYLLVLLDLFRGKVVEIVQIQIFILTLFGLLLGIIGSGTFVITHVTRVMFYTTLVISISIFAVLGAESITLLDHGVAYFFTVIFVTVASALGVYRYIHHISGKAHFYIQSKFKNGDLIKINLENDS
ncbi:MAG: hypothetical protein Q8P72_02755 [Candidatus Roizmanbacteria bacterium]|nr:hypothetical protein [Candidatus Roizmanbacteria bacterium]